MALTKNSRKNAPSAQESVLNTRIRRSAVQNDVSFISEQRIPAGTYNTTVVGVFEAVNNKGNKAIDIVYDFVDDAGTRRQAKERLNLGSFTLESLIDHWLDVGQLDESSTYGDIMGIAETVDVVYKRPGGFGSLQGRKPRRGEVPSKATTKAVASKETAAIVDYEEEDDFLSMEDDDYLAEEDDD
jgi:hypothetical protein